jgi:hypothetical protein
MAYEVALVARSASTSRKKKRAVRLCRRRRFQSRRRRDRRGRVGEAARHEPDWDDAVAKDRPSRVTCELSAAGPSTTKLHIVHDDFDGPTATYIGSVEGCR